MLQAEHLSAWNLADLATPMVRDYIVESMNFAKKKATLLSVMPALRLRSG